MKEDGQIKLAAIAYEVNTVVDASITNKGRLSKDEDEDPSDFPDGGWRAWSVLLGSWCALVPPFGAMNVAGVLESWLSAHQLHDYSKASVSWIFSLWFFFFYFGGILIGPIFDRHGLRVTMIPGCIGLTISFMIFSVSQEFYQFILGFSILGGLSASCIVTPSYGCINHWFFKRRGLVTGIACTAAGVGGIVFNVLIGSLSGKIGFAWTARVLGFVCIAFCIAGFVLMKTRLPLDSQAGIQIDLYSLTEIIFTATAIASCMADAGLLIAVVYLPSYALSHGVRGSLSYNIMSIFHACSILGRVIPGFLADHWGRFNIMFITSVACTALACGLWSAADNNEATIVSFAALFGFWAGPTSSLPPVCVAQISRTEHFGKRWGTTSCLISFVTLVTIPVAGSILKVQNPGSGQEQDYSGLIVLCGATYACCSVLLILAKGLSVGWKLSKVF